MERRGLLRRTLGLIASGWVSQSMRFLLLWTATSAHRVVHADLTTEQSKWGPANSLSSLSESSLKAITIWNNPQFFNLFHDNWENYDDETKIEFWYALYRSLMVRWLVPDNAVSIETISFVGPIFHPDSWAKIFLLEFNRNILVKWDRVSKITVGYTRFYAINQEDRIMLWNLQIHHDKESNTLTFPLDWVVSILWDGNTPSEWRAGTVTRKLPMDRVLQFRIQLRPDWTLIMNILFENAENSTQIYIRNIGNTQFV